VSSFARLCFRRRFVVLGGWIVLLVTLAAAVLSAGPAFSDFVGMPDSESATAYSLLARAGAGQSASGASAQTGIIVWHTNSAPIDNPRIQHDATAMLNAVAALPGIKAVANPYTEAGAWQCSDSANTAYASVVVDKSANIDRIRSTVHRLASATVQVAAGGQALTAQPGASNDTEGIGILAAVVVLLILVRRVWGPRCGP
jgi:RND superfamily putative drug exporter